MWCSAAHRETTNTSIYSLAGIGMVFNSLFKTPSWDGVLPLYESYEGRIVFNKMATRMSIQLLSLT